ncbi:GNAT family N-acetyltransferase [Haladaptatus sp. ZSTT2]|uniref:GNAT family N-acetyltransferase n=1 Tax=Haladaptatus sp. ZSTT2 TaxID=3120515 RepID=UPI00300F4294
MPETTVTELTTEVEWRAAYPVMAELRPIPEEQYMTYLRTMADEGYRLFGLFEGDDLLAVGGVRISTTFYHGSHIWVYDLVTREDRRSEGHGETLLAHLEQWGADRGCAVIELASGLWRDDAHRFYENRMDYERYCYTFKKDLHE